MIDAIWGAVFLISLFGFFAVLFCCCCQWIEGRWPWEKRQ